MLIIDTGKVLWWYQMSLHNMVIDLGTLKVLVETHGSRVEFVPPDDRKIYYGPYQWYCIGIACKHVIRSWEYLYHGMSKRVLVGNEIKLGMVDTKWSDLRQVIYRETKGIDYIVNGSRDH
jgi:hypothetical protein